MRLPLGRRVGGGSLARYNYRPTHTDHPLPSLLATSTFPSLWQGHPCNSRASNWQIGLDPRWVIRLDPPPTDSRWNQSAKVMQLEKESIRRQIKLLWSCCCDLQQLLWRWAEWEKNGITDVCSTADCLVNLVERMKRQRMKTVTYCH